jgi:hypothetical protein
VRVELQPAVELARTLDAEEIVRFLADIEEIRIVALGILMRPPPAPPDTLLDAEQLAARLNVSTDFIYRHQKRFVKFSRREGRKLLFSSSGLDAYLKRSR